MLNQFYALHRAVDFSKLPNYYFSAVPAMEPENRCAVASAGMMPDARELSAGSSKKCFEPQASSDEIGIYRLIRRPMHLKMFFILTMIILAAVARWVDNSSLGLSAKSRGQNSQSELVPTYCLDAWLKEVDKMHHQSWKLDLDSLDSLVFLIYVSKPG